MKIVRRGRAPRRRRVGPARRARPGSEAVRAARRSVARRTPKDIWPAFVEQGALVRRRRRDQAAAGRHRRGERDGRRDAAAGARAAADRRRHAATSSPTGRFPNHEPNPLLPENREFIVAQDARGAAPTSASRTTATPTAASSSTTPASSSPATSSPRCSPSRSSRRSRGGKVIYDVRASRAVPETIERAGGVALINRVGHAYIKHRMREEDAVFGGEVSAHYYFRDFSQADSGVVPFLLMLELISKRGRKLSELLAPYRERYFLTGEINTPVADVPLKLQELEERFGPRARVTHLDGSRSTTTTGTSTSARRTPSRCCASTSRRSRQELMERKRDEVLDADPRVTRSSSAASPIASRRSSTRRSPASASRTPTRRESSTTAATCRTSTTPGSSTTATSACRGTDRGASSSCARSTSSTTRRPASTTCSRSSSARADRPHEHDVTSAPPTAWRTTS